MYHFVSEQTQELRLSDNVLVTSHTTRYLKSFQLEAVRFMYGQLSKQEFCILNDESGLGKCAAVAALLNALGPNKKTLIVLQNDEQMLVGWQFHFGVLTELPVCVIQNSSDSTESAHSVYLAKWSVLRSIGDLSKLRFDHVIVDHRGYTLNNSFCTSMLLKQFERKVNIVISSVDITSDVKLLYNVLRMGGRLEYQLKSFKSFEQKFRLPDAKEVFNKRVDLEEYYKRRGRLGDYVKDFRLRRYRHQFDQCLPLVTPEQYKTNLTLWLANNNSNTTLSGSTIASLSDVRSTAGPVEIIECLMKIKNEREFAQREEPEKFSEHSDEVVAMSPLVFEMSDTEMEQTVEGQSAEAAAPVEVVLLSSEDCEIVTPPMTPRPSSASGAKSKRKNSQKAHIADLAVLTESEAKIVTPRRQTRSADNTPRNGKSKKPKLEANGEGISGNHNLRTRSAGSTPLSNKTKKLNVRVNRVTLEQMAAAKPMPKDSDCKTLERTPKRQTRMVNISPPGVHNRQTRSMQRLTRSADARIRNKYMTASVALDIDKKSMPKKRSKPLTNQTPKTSKMQPEEATPCSKAKEETPKRIAGKANDTKIEAEPPKETIEAKKVMNAPARSTEKLPKLQVKVKPIVGAAALTTPQLISSGSTNSDFAYMPCAQKLPDDLSLLDTIDLPAFRMPFTPLSTPLLLSSTLNMNLLNDSDVTYVPKCQQRGDIVIISSSHDESSQQSNGQSRRTRALKRKRKQSPSSSKNAERPSTSSFGKLLAQQRAHDKSPDVFSNCSDVSQLTLAQPAPANAFEGFKIFGSEVKQLQQQHAKTQGSGALKKKRERSCLDILEQMFEPRQQTASNHVLPTYPPAAKPQPQTIELDEDIFEITSNGEFGSRLRLNSTGNVSPVQPQHQQRPTQHKITNYLIGPNATPEEELLTPSGQRSANSTRKSPKGIKSTQSTKLTRWFGATAAGDSVSAPSTPVTQASSAGCQAARTARRSGGPTKRKRLELYK